MKRKIYTYIRSEWNGSEYVTVDSESYDYDGPMAFCDGGDEGEQVGMGIMDPLDLFGIRGGRAAETAAEHEREANKEARDAIAAGQDKALAFLKDLFQQGIDYEQAQLKPYRELQLGALRKIKSMDETETGISPLATLSMEESERGINRAARARGLYSSGASLEAISRSNERILAQEMTRKEARLGVLAGIPTSFGSSAGTFAGVGQSGSGTITGASQNQAGFYQNLGNINARASTAQYTSMMSGANAVVDFAGNIIGGMMGGA